MSKNREIERKNLAKALEKNEQMIERYSDQIKSLNDPAVNSLLEGVLHNKMIHKAEIGGEIQRLGP
ncbi:MAG: hypothetical protein GY941_30650 [Planctomycetes bacterium]|nr:hypothetical protein [Planctomycetota bacterium]